jgi:uncharacterized protein (TIGR03067 family)
MITGVHTMFYSSKPEELRAFIRDKLGFPWTDVRDGWLIFDLPDAEMGCHPAESEEGQRSGTHYISFYCDDIKKTVAELKARGVEFTDEISDAGYGLATHFKMPGDIQVQLYQPYYKRASSEGKAKDDREKLAGLWTSISGINDGNPLPGDIVKQLKLTLTQDRYKTEKGNVVLFDGPYKIDAGQLPKHIDITAPVGEQAGKTSKGIYSLEGDALSMCYAVAEKDRPKEFESKPGSGATLVVWKRAK